MADFNPDAYLAKKTKKVEPVDEVSGFDPDLYLEKEEPGILQRAGTAALEGIGEVGKFVDTYTGAPARKAIGVLQDDFTAIPEAVMASVNQFGEDPRLAPTGQELARKAGVSDASLSELLPSLYNETGEGVKLQKGGFLDPTASGVAGFGLDVAADPTNFIPVGAIAKGAAKGVGKVAPFVAKGVGKVATVGANIGKAIVKPLVPDVVSGIAKSGTEIFKSGTAAVKNTQDAISKFINPKIATTYKDAVASAAKHGIDPNVLPSSVKYGPESSITRLEKTLSQRPGGEKIFDQYKVANDAVKEAFDTKLVQIGDGVPPLTPADAGDVLREGFNSTQRKFFDSIDTSYKSIAKANPDLAMTEASIDVLKKNMKPILDQAQSTMKNAALSAGARSQAKQVAEVGQGILKQAETGRYGDIVDSLSELGSAFEYSPRGLSDIPPDLKAYRKMYTGAREALVKTVEESVGKDVAEKLVKNNKAMTEWFNEAGKIEGLIENVNKAPETVFKQIVESGDTNKLRALKNVLMSQPGSGGEAALKRLKASFIENLKVVGPDDTFSFARLRSNIANDGKTQRVLKELFDASEIQDINEIVSLGESIGSSVLNTSKTAEASMFGKFMEKPLVTMSENVQTQQLLDFLKRRAEGAPDLKPVGEFAAPAAQEVLSKFGGMPQRSLPEKALKGAQVFSVQDYDTDTDRVVVPLEMSFQLNSAIMKSKMTNTEKAKVIRGYQKDGSISNQVLRYLESVPQ